MRLELLTRASGRTPASYQLSTYLMRRCRMGVWDRSWVAEIVGTHLQYGLDKEFVGRTKIQIAPNVDGRQTFGPLYVGRVYQYGAIAEDGSSGYQYCKGNYLSGFFDIHRGQIHELPKQHVEEYAQHLRQLRRRARLKYSQPGS